MFSALSRRQLGAIPLAAVLAAALLLVGSANAPAARTSKAPCASKSSAKAKRNAHREACPARKHKGHAKAKRHHTKHTLKTKRHTTTATDTAAALCDNGSEPQAAGDGTFSCADGSEPGCEAGLEATPSPSGSELTCVAPSDSESATQTCEEEDAQPCWEEGSEQGPEGVEGSTEGG